MTSVLGRRCLQVCVAGLALLPASACGLVEVDRATVDPYDDKAISGQVVARAVNAETVVPVRECRMDGVRRVCPRFPTLTVRPERGRAVTFRVGREIYVRCAEGARYPQCAAAGGER